MSDTDSIEMMTDEQRALIILRVCAEQRALELLRIARRALRGEPYWRVELQTLVDLIDGGVLPEPLKCHPHQEAA